MKIFRDPITHFILIGLALVAINHFWEDYQGEQGRTIVVSAAEMDRLGKIWANTAGRLPTGEDKQQIIDQYVQEEVLVREAERLGLGNDDTIIRRRLAQKMDFLVSEDAASPDPSDDVLEQWFDENRSEFAAPERRSFVHVYLSPERHRDAVQAAAEAALTRIKGGADWKNLGDPFIQKRSYAAIPLNEVTRLFGPDFAQDIFKLEANEWSMPIGSAYGLHLVRIETIDSAANALFEPMKPQILAAWREDRSIQSKQAALKKLVSEYQVVVEGAEE